MNGSPLTGGLKLQVFRPRHLDDARALITAVRHNQAVVLDSSSIRHVEAQRLIDYVCGGMNALSGQSHRIDADTFLFTPGHARVDA